MSTEFDGTKKSAAEEFGAESTTYDRNYDPTADRYPDHVFRLNIFKSLLASLRPRYVLDAGCGSGIPLLTFLNNGFDAYGFDLSPDMVAQTRKNIQQAGHNESRVFQGDLDTFERPIVEKFDAIVGLGTVYYTPDTLTTLRHLVNNLTPDGNLIFSLRNELFHCFHSTAIQLSILQNECTPRQNFLTNSDNRCKSSFNVGLMMSTSRACSKTSMSVKSCHTFTIHSPSIRHCWNH